MTKFLLRHFVPDWERAEDQSVRSRVGRLAGVTGIGCNCLLALVKFLAGALTGSIAILADGMNNLSDAGSSVMTLVGFRLAQRPADEAHPYGHARYEYLSALAVAALILLIGVELGQASFRKILQPEAVEFTALTAGILLGSIALKLWMSRFFAVLGEHIHSGTLKATAVDSRNDVIATSAVLAGCLVQQYFHVNADGYIGLGVAAFIVYSGVRMMMETVSPLLGKQADAELVGQLSALLTASEKVLGIHDLLIHDYGPGQCFASVHAELSAGLDALTCHAIIDGLEQEARDRLNVHLVIHYDPVAVDDREWRELRAIVAEAVRDVDESLSMHDFRLIRQSGQTQAAFELGVPLSQSGAYSQLQAKIEAALAEKNFPYPTKILFEGKM